MLTITDNAGTWRDGPQGYSPFAERARLIREIAGEPLPQSCGCMTFSPDDPLMADLGYGLAAIRYTGFGDAVIPLTRGGKPPHRMLSGMAPPGQGGAWLGRSDRPWIESCWHQDRLAGVGVVTGRLPPQAGQRRVLVITDLDVKNGDNGPAIFAQFLASNGLRLPAGPVDATPNGGWHLWLAAPPGTAVPQRNHILPGVDIKGDGGYAVAPPSMLNVTAAGPAEQGMSALLPYRWVSGCPHAVPQAPPWFMEWIRHAPSAGGSGSGGSGNGEPVPELDALIRTGIPRGERNDTLHRLACSRYRRLGSDSAQVADELRAVWEAGDTAGLPWREVASTAESARRFVAEQESKDAAVLAVTSRWLQGIRETNR